MDLFCLRRFHVALFVDFSIIHTVDDCEDEVRGLTSLSKKLDVFRDVSSDQVDVYDMNSNYRLMRRHLSVPGSNVWDMTSNTVDRCLFMSEFVDKKVFKVTIAGDLTEYDVGDLEPRGLSMMTNGNLLVSCRNHTKLVELDDDGICAMHSVDSDEWIPHLWHAVQMSNGDFVVCHGSGPHLHRVCIIDRFGSIERTFWGLSGSGEDELNVPCHLAVDENDFIFVADCLNKRVTLLSPMLSFIRHVKSEMASRPQRLYLDRDTKRLYVGQRDGDVIVIQL